MLVALLLSLMVMGLAAVVSRDFRYEPSQEQVSLFDGTQVSIIEDGFTKALPLRNWAVSHWSSWRYALYGEGLPGVIISHAPALTRAYTAESSPLHRDPRDTWLYSDESWYLHPDGAEDLLESIPKISSQLNELGIELLVVPLPSKPMLRWDDDLPSYPEALYRGYENFLAYLDDISVSRVDVLASLGGADDINFNQSELRSIADGYFQRTDTHWSPQGARRTAEIIAHSGTFQDLSAIQGSFPTAGLFESKVVETQAYRGDLFEFLPSQGGCFGPFYRPMPAEEEVNIWETVRTQALSAGLFGDPHIDVALVGTSYSAQQTWNFPGFLREALQRDLIVFAAEGEGPLDPMLEALDSGKLQSYGVKILIWEIPIRYVGSI